MRELENLVQRLLAMVEGDTIDAADLPAEMHSATFCDGRGPDRTLAEVEREYVRRVLERCGGNKTRAAKVLGIDRKTLRQKLGPGPKGERPAGEGTGGPGPEGRTGRPLRRAGRG